MLGVEGQQTLSRQAEHVLNQAGCENKQKTQCIDKIDKTGHD